MSLQEKMRQLFLLDQQVRGMRSRLDAALSRLTKQQKKIEQQKRQRAELADQLKVNQAKAATFENQSKDIELKVEQLRGQMNNVKNNKEYSALLVEVNTLKVDKSKIEDQALEFLNKIDTLKAEASAVDKLMADQAKLIGVSESEVATCKAEIGKELDELMAKRTAAEQDIPIDAMATFNKLVQIHDGDAVAHVTEENRKHLEYNCGGCYIGLPIERVNSLMRRPNEIICCPSCGRILYLDAELKATFTVKA